MAGPTETNGGKSGRRSSPRGLHPLLSRLGPRRLLVFTVALVLLGTTLFLLNNAAGPTRAAAVHGTTPAPGSIKEAKNSGLKGVEAIDPAAFAPGACLAYPPTSGDRRITVFLDAGHGGVDPGAVGITQSGQTIYEATETLAVELDTMALLRQAGFRVVVSRTSDTTVIRLGPADVQDGILTVQGSHDDVLARDVCANDAGAAVLVGIYFDAGTSSNAGSVTAYDAARPFAADNLRLAELIQSDVLAAMNAQGWGIPDEGVMPDTGLGSVAYEPGSALSNEALAYGHLALLGPADPGYLNTPSQMPGALIEPLFITDAFEGSIAASSPGQQTIAGGLAQAIEQYLAPPPAAPKAPQ